MCGSDISECTVVAVYFMDQHITTNSPTVSPTNQPFIFRLCEEEPLPSRPNNLRTPTSVLIMSAFDTTVTAPTATPAAAAAPVAPCSFDQFHSFLPSILQNIPQEWRGTTFKNSHLLGRELFSHNLCQLVSSKASFSPPQEITTQDLIDLGNAEDYLRVASNISCLLETYVALQKNYVISQVFTFASSNLSIISVLLTSSGIPVHLYLGDHGEESISPFTDEHLRMLSLLSADLHIHHTFPPSSSPSAEAIILAYESNEMDMFQHPLVDGIIRNTTHGHGGSDADADDGTHSHGSDGGGILYIKNIHKIIPSQILIIRKRLATPMTSPIAENLLYEFVHLQSPQSSFHYSSKDLEIFQSHLQTLSGLPMNHNSLPICYTAGLPAICSLWMTLLAHGGADVVMASTSYGGSSELTDIFQSKAIHNLFNKYKFDITGTKNIHTAIESTLATLSSLPSPPSSSSSSSRTTVLFVEIPTNPDMKVPNILQLATILMNYQQTTSRPVLLLIDTTFAPGSQILSKIEKLFPHLPTMIFISMSKSISRGMTTAGTLISGSSNEACQLLQQVHTATAMFDTKAKSDQMKRLIENHVGVEERCQAAYQNACYLGKVLQDAVYELCEGRYEMSLAFVTKENAQDGFTSSTFSFNLPSISWTRPPSSSASSSDAPADAHADGDMEINANLAQRFVTLLCEHTEEFKPCVSFGQDNGLVYATVPATSTQGAIHPDDKAKQAVGGVQLTRLSFPPSCDLGKLEVILKNALRDCYAIVG
jgi:cystathionine beta-lyase/cystathionine gamma-synthase